MSPVDYPFGEDEYRDQLYTARQSRLLTNLPRVPAFLSILGSSTILYIIYKDWKRKLKRVYHRLLLAYSSVDVVCSFNYGLSALIVPKGTPGVWGALGTVATCEASGFVTQFSLALGVYASFICLYYALVLRYGVREQTLAKTLEPSVHAIALIPPIIFGIAMLVKNNYNPTNAIVGWCFINVYPMDCLRREHIECERGDDYLIWLIMNNAPFFIFIPTVIVSCVMTYLKVRSISLRSRRWSLGSSSPSDHRVNETATQAFLYISAFLLTYVFFGVATLVGPSPATEQHRSFYFPVVIFIKIFLPLNGFWNCFIYIRPRFRAIQRRKPDLSAWEIFKIILASGEESTIVEGVERGGLANKSRGSFRLPNPNPPAATTFRQWIAKRRNATKEITSTSQIEASAKVSATSGGIGHLSIGRPLGDFSVGMRSSRGDDHDDGNESTSSDDDEFMPEFCHHHSVIALQAGLSSLAVLVEEDENYRSSSSGMGSYGENTNHQGVIDLQEQVEEIPVDDSYTPITDEALKIFLSEDVDEAVANLDHLPPGTIMNQEPLMAAQDDSINEEMDLEELPLPSPALQDDANDTDDSVLNHSKNNKSFEKPPKLDDV